MFGGNRQKYALHCDMTEADHPCSTGRIGQIVEDYRDDPDIVDRLKLGQLKVEVNRVLAHVSCKQLEDREQKPFQAGFQALYCNGHIRVCQMH